LFAKSTICVVTGGSSARAAVQASISDPKASTNDPRVRELARGLIRESAIAMFFAVFPKEAIVEILL
jgi:hypothetical protein